MSKSALARRVRDLEKLYGAQKECYVLVDSFMDLRMYWILFTSEMEPKHYPCSAGPFKSIRDAHMWRLQQIQRLYPQGYERLIKTKSQQEIKKKYLTVAIHFDELAKEPQTEVPGAQL